MGLKYKAPENGTSINIGGEQFNVGDDGCIDLPEGGDYHAILTSHGYTPFVAEPEQPASNDGDDVKKSAGRSKK